MNMFKPSTAKTVEEYIELIPEPRKTEIKHLHSFIQKTVPKLKPYLLGSIIGYGTYHYKGKSGREGDWFQVGLASQKNYISVYACASDGKKYIPEYFTAKLPKASIGKSCIRFKKTADIDLKILAEILKKNRKNILQPF